MRDPSTFVPPFEEALEDVVRNQDPKYLEEGQHVNLGLTGRRVSLSPRVGGHSVTTAQNAAKAAPCSPSKTHSAPRSFGFANVSPRELLTGFVGTMVQVEGIVTKCAPPARSAAVRVPAELRAPLRPLSALV